MDKELYFLPLGGSGEIGMNLNLYGVDGKWLMVDMGVSFTEHLGLEVIMPDIAYIEEHKDKLIGLVATHAHEDHIGAIPHLWSKLRCPIYATPFTAALVREKLKEAGISKEVELHVVPLSTSLSLGPFDISFISLTHSIPEPNGLLIKTSKGSIFHTGDWKIDPDPVVGDQMDQKALESLGSSNVLAMVCDSTNVFNKSTAGSEKDVQENIDALIEEYKDKDQRVFVTCFASNLARLYTIGKAAQKAGRSVGIFGRSLGRMDRIARENGYLKGLPPFLSADEVMKLPRSKGLIITTGSQGEPRAGLKRIAGGFTRGISMEDNDVVIFSSRMIPGNERRIGELQNSLIHQNVKVITPINEDIHVSGHPGQAELKQMYAWVKPKIAVPVHGEMRHMSKQAELALEWGVPQSIVPRNGAMIQLSGNKPKIVDEVPCGRIVLDHGSLVPMSHPVVRERFKMSSEGALFATVFLDQDGSISADTLLSSFGLHLSDESLDEICIAAEDEIGMLPDKKRQDDDIVAETARILLRRTCMKIIGQKPPTMVHIVRD